jgi:hypothetical protein
MEKDSICDYHSISRLQRLRELRDGLTTAGTKGYEVRGCYNCNGFDENCPVYKSILEERRS